MASIDLVRLNILFITQGTAKAVPERVHFTVFPCKCDWRTNVGSSKIHYYFWLFESLENLYPPKGLCKSRTQWGPFDVLSILLCMKKGAKHFQFTGRYSPLWYLEMLHPSMGLCETRTRWGPFDILSILLSLEKGV